MAKKNKNDRFSLYTVRTVDRDIRLPHSYDCHRLVSSAQCYAFLILTLFPLLIGPETYINITKTKFAAFVVLTCLFAAACLILGFFPSGARSFSRPRFIPVPRITVPQGILMAYMIWAIVCTIVSPYKGLWLGQSRYEGLCSLLLYGVAFLLLSFWGEYNNMFFYGSAAMGVLLGAIVLPQSFGSTFLYPEGYNYWNTEFLTTIGNRDCVAGIVCILIPTLLCAFVILNERLRYLCLPALFFLTYTVAFSDVDTAKLGCLTIIVLLPFLIQTRMRLSRLLIGLSPMLAGIALNSMFPGREERHFAMGAGAGIMVLTAAALYFFGRYLGKRKGNWRVKPGVVLRIGYAFTVVLLSAALIYLFVYDGDNGLLTEASAFLHGKMDDGAGSGRGVIWKKTWELITQRPVFGGGPGSFKERFMPYNDAYNTAKGRNEVIDFAHNDFLNIGACTGLVGLGLYAAFLAALLVRCFRKAERCPVLLILLAGILGYLVYSFFVFSIAIVSPLFWVMAGLADQCVRQASAIENCKTT